MKSYLINLDRDVARLAAQRKQFESLGISFERVPAFETARIDAFRWWCAVLRPVVKGELGCAASHCECYRRIVESGAGCAAVFEDDVLLSRSAKSALESACVFCRENPKALVLLGDHHESKTGRFSDDVRDPVKIISESWDDCSEGYVIGKDAAARLLKAQSPVRTPADWWSYFRKKGLIDLYRADPPVCRQQTERFGSNVGERYVCEGRGVAERVWWRVRRAVGVAIDTVLDGRPGW